ncbi:MAG: M91 family zinc metallopeptidase [Nocardioides sp.]|uniref:M91 family zinc metallopeptidase n=1 Tax=Nocardioides sp. TaxID=35761 RepID=UPI003F0D28F0
MVAVRGPWELRADVAALDRASLGWERLGSSLSAAGKDVDDASTVALKQWTGASAQSYDTHRRSLGADVTSAAAQARNASSSLRNAAAQVRGAQQDLDGSWATVAHVPVSSATESSVVFAPRDEAEEALVRTASTRATEIRSALDAGLAKDGATLSAAIAAWDQIAARWASVADGSRSAFTVPSGSQGAPGVITVGNLTVVTGTDGDDTITVTVDAAGNRVVTVNGVAHTIPAGQELVVRGGRGSDTVTVPTGNSVHLTLSGGDGLDRIHGGDGDERILGGRGDDEIDAGAGDDRVRGDAGHDYLNGQRGNDELFGGDGRDTLYGLEGNDALVGGAEQDYLEGGTGNDVLSGGAGNDIGSGGDGDDRINGGAGDDVSYAGRGADSTSGGSGTDTAHDEAADASSGVERAVTVEVGDGVGGIRIEGSPDFVQRVEADLQMLAASPRGQEMIENLQGHVATGPDTLTIREYHNPADPDNSTASTDGTNSVINYNTRLDNFGGAPPVVVVYHELAHVYDYMNGTFDSTPYAGSDTNDTGIRQGERQATGLPIDHDHRPGTPEVIDPDHDYGLTENGLRDELGLPNRDHYRF